MNIEKIETNRLYLRPFTKDDALFAISIWNDPEMGEYLGDPALETIDPEYVKEIEALGDDPICCYLIAESKTTGERIGTCSFIPLKDQTVYDIAYCVNKLHWRKGYATEMIQGMIAYANSNALEHARVGVTGWIYGYVAFDAVMLGMIALGFMGCTKKKKVKVKKEKC